MLSFLYGCLVMVVIPALRPYFLRHSGGRCNGSGVAIESEEEERKT
jgi:hypothetical protein